MVVGKLHPSLIINHEPGKEWDGEGWDEAGVGVGVVVGGSGLWVDFWVDLWEGRRDENSRPSPAHEAR